MIAEIKKRPIKPTFLDFFAGSGLVTEALKPCFKSLWANDICEKKSMVYCANHPRDIFHLGPIEEINGRSVPDATLSWASFPCQDLSLAGNMKGIDSSRSGLVWQWLRIMDEMQHKPPIVVAENVLGLVSAKNGEYYRRLHNSLVERNYLVGAIVLDAACWVPQSRPRVFVVGVINSVDISHFCSVDPIWCHPTAVQRIGSAMNKWVWWKMRKPTPRKHNLEDIIDYDAPCDDSDKRKKVLSLVPDYHWKRVKQGVASGLRVFPGYRRIRNSTQVLELRFDGLAGCLRTPEGGSSRQVVVIRRKDHYDTRLLTVRETARLMGLSDRYEIPGSYNDGYKAMGDAVAVPAARYLASNLLLPLTMPDIYCGDSL